jgi:hypothetical protein
MSDLHGLDDSAGAPGVAGDPALPPPPDDSLLRDFLQVRAMAQHANVAARLDAFAAAHDAATTEAPVGGGIRLHWGPWQGDSDVPPVSPGGAAPQSAPGADPAASDAARTAAPSSPPAAVAPQPAPGSDPAAPGTVPPDAASQATPEDASPSMVVPEPDHDLAADDTVPLGLKLQLAAGKVVDVPPSLTAPTRATADGSPSGGSSSSLLTELVPGAEAGQKAYQAFRAGNYGTAVLQELQGVAEAALAIGTLGEGTAVLQGTRAVATRALSFRNFEALKRYLGSPGVGMEWHHIVEQSQIPQFGKEAIHDIRNMVAIPEQIHDRISGFYASKPFFTNGLRVREWLRGQSFAEQYEYGVKKLAQLLGY